MADLERSLTGATSKSRLDERIQSTFQSQAAKRMIGVQGNSIAGVPGNSIVGVQGKPRVGAFVPQSQSKPITGFESIQGIDQPVNSQKITGYSR